MPPVFDNITDKVTGSRRGMRYSGTITPLGNGRAAIAMDYVFMNRGDSGIQIQLAMDAPDGRMTYLTNVINVPLRRGRITYMEGAFLTSGGSSGIDIDFGFDGDINIKI